MKVLIVEDEQPARKRLRRMLEAYAEPTTVVGEISSIEEGIHWLQQHIQPDIILLDIQLTDGLSHRIFEEVAVSCPVVFITAFDHHLTQAFQYHCLDYLLKPVKEEQLYRALAKSKRVEAHYAQSLNAFLMEYAAPKPKYRERLLLRKGLDLIPLKLTEVAYFYTEYKVVFAVSHSGIKHLSGYTLTQLETSLDPALFFRVNRKYLLGKEAVSSVRPLPKGRLEVQLLLDVDEEIGVNQPKAQAFKDWLAG